MKAAYLSRVGPPENIQFGELATPDVGPSDVLVKTTAVCVDPVDTLIRSGQLPETMSFPFIVGRDMAGVVQAVGPAVRRFAPGDRVWCNNQGYHGRQGTFAEYLAVREDLLYPLSPGVDDREAVAFVHSRHPSHTLGVMFMCVLRGRYPCFLTIARSFFISVRL